MPDFMGLEMPSVRVRVLSHPGVWCALYVMLELCKLKSIVLVIGLAMLYI